jgi:rubrerythrin
MSSIKGSKTEKNLMIAFAGESMAISRYEYYAKVAKREGYEQIAAIFEETAEQEKSHAKTFYRFIEGSTVDVNACYPVALIGTTIENLKASLEGEHEEWSEVYAAFEKTAWEEGFKDIATQFKLIATIEKFHEERFSMLLDNIKKGKVFKREKKVKWQCRKCGFIHESKTALQNCPACGHQQAYFEILAENY